MHPNGVLIKTSWPKDCRSKFPGNSALAARVLVLQANAEYFYAWRLVFFFFFGGGGEFNALHYNNGSNLAEKKSVLGASCNSNVAEARFEIIPE